MKSLFGGIKNYFGGKSDPPPPPTATPNGTSTASASNRRPYESKLGSTIESLSTEAVKSANHPTFARKGIVFEEDEEEQGKSMTGKGGKSSARSQEIEKALDSNLGELSLGLGRLKSLAMGLGTEIESQNDMLERIMTKEERAEETIGYQNRQMKQILKK
jgi:synaptosomal-associated protein 29